MMVEKRKRDYSLDFLKFISSVFILFHHYQQIVGFNFKKGINFYGGSFYFGLIVELFFILSGYFMFTYIERISSGLSLRDFWTKRFFRVFPIMMLGAAMFEIALVVYRHFCGELWLGNTTSLWEMIIASAGMQHGWVFVDSDVNHPTWYVSVLLLCYLFFYIMTRLSIKCNIPTEYSYIFMVLLGIGIRSFEINLPFFNHYSGRGFISFFWGIILAIILNRRKITPLIMGLSVSVLLIFSLLFRYRYDFVNDGIQYLLIFAIYPAIIILCKSTWLACLLNRSIWGWLSKISFVVYILHVPLLIFTSVIARLLDMETCMKNFAAMCTFLLLNYALGTLTYFFIESPIENLIYERYKLNC